MDFSVAREVYVFFACVLAGPCIGLVYDLLRVMRSFARPSATLTDVEDIVFWCAAAVILFFVIFYTNGGRVRWFEFFGAVLGAVFYFLTLGRLFRLVIRRIIEIFSKIFIFFCKILLTPARFMYNILYRIILFIFVPIRRLSGKLSRRLITRVKAGTKKTKAALFKK